MKITKDYKIIISPSYGETRKTIERILWDNGFNHATETPSGKINEEISYWDIETNAKDVKTNERAPVWVTHSNENRFNATELEEITAEEFIKQFL